METLNFEKLPMKVKIKVLMQLVAQHNDLVFTLKVKEKYLFIGTTKDFYLCGY